MGSRIPNAWIATIIIEGSSAALHHRWFSVMHISHDYLACHRYSKWLTCLRNDRGIFVDRANLSIINWNRMVWNHWNGSCLIYLTACGRYGARWLVWLMIKSIKCYWGYEPSTSRRHNQTQTHDWLWMQFCTVPSTSECKSDLHNIH